MTSSLPPIPLIDSRPETESSEYLEPRTVSVGRACRPPVIKRLTKLSGPNCWFNGSSPIIFVFIIEVYHLLFLAQPVMGSSLTSNDPSSWQRRLLVTVVVNQVIATHETSSVRTCSRDKFAALHLYLNWQPVVPLAASWRKWSASSCVSAGLVMDPTIKYRFGPLTPSLGVHGLVLWNWEFLFLIGGD